MKDDALDRKVRKLPSEPSFGPAGAKVGVQANVIEGKVFFPELIMV